MSSMSATLVAPGMDFSSSPDLDLAARLFALEVQLRRRNILCCEIFRRTWQAELVSPTIDHWVARAKVIEGRRRRDAPFECGGPPGIAVLVFFPRNRLQRKLSRKSPCAETVRIVATVMNVRAR